MPLASQQLLPHRRYQGTSLIKSGALGLLHKPHLPCRLGKGYPAVHFSCVSWQLGSAVSPIGKDSADGRGASTRQSLRAQLEATSPLLLTSKAGLAGTWCLQAVQMKPACQHVILRNWLFVYRTLCHLLQFPSASSSTCSKDTGEHLILTLRVNSNHHAPSQPAYSIDKCWEETSLCLVSSRKKLPNHTDAPQEMVCPELPMYIPS